MVAVNLASLEPVNRERQERTYADNISPHGARVRSTHAWKLGDLAEITPVSGETPVHGEVVYCQKLDVDIEKCRFCGSDKQKKFTAEIAIHLADIDKPHVFVFPELRVCQQCGKAEFTIPPDRLRFLKK